MISRFYLKDYLSFDSVDLEFENGLIVFTGPSGAGKSILMDAFLALFGHCDAKAVLSEVIIDNQTSYEPFGIEKHDDIVIKEIKKEKIRYFLNDQTISKKNLQEFSKTLIKHLHLKDTSDFDSANLIKSLDTISSKTDEKFIDIKNSYESAFKSLQEVKNRLEQIYKEEAKLEELKDFARYEIEKIEKINPKEDEYEKLESIKKSISKKEKVEEALEFAKPIFQYSNQVSKALDLMEKNSSFFDETINELNNIFETFSDTLYELEDLDIETILTRIEELSSLQKKHGSIKDALVYKDKKMKELESYENISFEKSKLEKELNTLTIKLEEDANKLTSVRLVSLELLEGKINHYLEYLYLSNAKINLVKKEFDITGCDDLDFSLNGVALNTISSGEFNRLRLALLTTMSKFEINDNGILFLDEIDANLSGKESETIAVLLNELSKNYQIFAISHQPQLTASAKQHFLVDKIDGKSYVKLLDQDEKIEEISRIISGESISAEALEFAKKLVYSK